VHSTVYATIRLPSVCISVTCQCCVETAEPRMMGISQHGSPKTLVSSNVKTLQKFEACLPQRNSYWTVTDVLAF